MTLLLLMLMIGISLLKIPERYKVFTFIFVLSTFTIITFGFGTDYFSYEFIYEYITLGGSINNELIEPLFALFAQLLRMMGVDFHIYISIIRVAILLLTVNWINKNSEIPSMSIILYFAMFYIVWTMSALRQGLVLAIGVNIYFSKKEIPIFKQIILALLLSMIHYSALFYLVIILLNSYKWNKKHQIYFLFLSLMITFIPFSSIVERMEFLPYYDKLIRYVEPNFGFFDFASLMRLFFFGTVYIMYDKLSKSEYMEKITNAFLFGTSLYFVMKFSETAASRFTIFTFILLVIILPDVFEALKSIEIGKISDKFMRISMTLVFTVFSFFFLSKEMFSYNNQSGYVGGANKYSVEWIFNKDYDKFDSSYAFRKSQVVKSQDFINDFQKNTSEISTSDFIKGSNYVSIYDSNYGKYGIMGEDGQWLIDPSLNENFSIVNGVMIKIYDEVLTPTETFEDLEKKIFDQNILRTKVATKRYENEFEIVSSEVLENLTFEDVIETPENFVPYPKNISDSKVVRVNQRGFEYHVVQFKYYHYNLNIYLDSNLDPFMDIVFTNYRDYNSEKFLYAVTYTGTLIFNSKGEVIWAV